jgi:amidase
MSSGAAFAPPPWEEGSLAGRPAGELAALVRSGQVTAVRVVEEHLRLIESLNPALNAFVHVAGNHALDEARGVDDALVRGEDPGPLAGVPFSVKDVISVEGMPFTAGSRALASHVGTEDAPAVRLLRESGAVCLGKTNTPEFALWTLTWNELFGYTANPHPSVSPRSPGGSSGGEAAAVASGMSAFGLGSDFGGSVRWPAHCTGLVSLRPTPGTVDARGQLPGRRRDGQWVIDPDTMQGRLQVVGPMARSVRDLRLVVDVLSAGSTGPRRTLSGVRVGWCDGEGTQPVDPEIVAATRHAASRLADANGVRLEVGPPSALAESVHLFAELRATDQHHDIRTHTRDVPPGPVISGLLSSTDPVSEARVQSLWQRRDALRDQMVAEMPDVLLLPVAAIGAPRLEQREFRVREHTLGPWQILACCQAISLFGLPAAVVPVGRFADGRNIGVQVVARPGEEQVALAVAAALEDLAGEDQ